MFVFYNPETLKVIHLITLAPPDYKSFLSTQPDQHWIETDEEYSIEEIDITPELKLVRRIQMSVTGPDSIPLGSIMNFAGVPEGANIFVNDAELGVMDASGSLEITAETAGYYTFRFEAKGFITKEMTVEVISQHSA